MMQRSTKAASFALGRLRYQCRSIAYCKTSIPSCSKLGPCMRMCTKLSSSSTVLEELRCKPRLYHHSASSYASQANLSASTTSLQKSPNSRATFEIDGQSHEFSAVLLRDLCECSACVHESTKQRLYSTADIPVNITVRSINAAQNAPDSVEITWNQDVPCFESSHVTTLKRKMLRELVASGATTTPFFNNLSQPVQWDASSNNIQDFDYQAYMENDGILLRVIEQLQTQGLAFVTNVPGIEASVSTIAERIGPVKDTFYGRTWDVRTVPKAINAAYTSNDLGFHTDLLYFQNPPHVQLLHCIQSSSSGGASVFADAFKCALELYERDVDAFNVLATTPVNYHYKHVNSNLYMATKPVFEMRPLRIGSTTYENLSDFLAAWENHRQLLNQTTGMTVPALEAIDCLEKINWGPPFMAPFSLQPDSMKHTSPGDTLNDTVESWHAAARKFSALLERPNNLYERLMKPGQCVLFNNTRVLHSRRAFDSKDVGKERWLRGTYVDKDPFLSKLRVLSNKFGPKVEQNGIRAGKKTAVEDGVPF